MTIEGAIVQLKELIANNGIPFWAKPSLQKVMETVEMEREQHIKALPERKATWSEVIATNVEHSGVIRHFCCSYCGRVVSVLYPQELELLYPYCHCGAKMEVEE